jgi:CRP/FNR family transcriptional regulator
MSLNVVETPANSPNGAHLRLAATSTTSPCNSCKHRRLNFCGVLGSEDGTIRKRHRSTTARHNVPGASDVSEGTLIICEGWAVRYIQLPNGKRQVLSVVLPGDLVSPASIFDRQKHEFSVQAVTDVRYCHLKSEDIQAKMASDPSVVNAWAQLTADENRNADDHLVDLGQRSAQERIASLILRIMAQFENRGELKDMEFPFPLRQQHIADLTGLTPVHVCRVLSAFRKDGIFQIEGGAAKVLDYPALESIAYPA